MLRTLRDIRVSWPAFAAVCAASAVATAFVLGSAPGNGSATQAAALAALRIRQSAIREASVQGSAGGAASESAQAVASGAGSGSVGAGSGGSDGSGGSGTGASSATSAGAADTSSGTGDASAATDDADDGTDDTSAATDGADDGTDDTNAGTAATTDSDSTTTTTTSTSTSTTSEEPSVGHVFEIALSTPAYRDVFAAGSAAPYLRSLVSKGALLSGYRSLTTSELADEIAMVSGQSPTADTRAGCPTYSDFASSAAPNAAGLLAGNGCVYPNTVLTLGDQVTSSGHTWKAYIADMGSNTCVHPNAGAADDVELPGTEPGYDTRHNPFIYFHSLLDLGDCANDDLDLSKLAHDLARSSRTATFSFIAPGICADAATLPATAGSASTSSTQSSQSLTSTPQSTESLTSTPGGTQSLTSTSQSTESLTSTPDGTQGSTSTSQSGQSLTSTPESTVTASGTATSTTSSAAAPASACTTGTPVGIGAEDAFLRSVVPEILRSSAYKSGGVLVIAFTPAGAASAAGAAGAAGSVRTGALVLSPSIHTRRTITTAFDAYSLLRSIEDMLGYTPLGHASKAASFAASLLG